ncbi:MAG: hypothetical protein K2L16_09895 [Muribaculaceae bacterium]|nr:hypothetical protein [Muribaculaceae bacterium]
MKNILTTILIAAALTACTDAGKTPVSELGRAQEAYEEGRYARSQAICDSLIIGSEFSDLNVDELCRLSMLFMRLGENAGDEEVNTALATRCLSAAFMRDSDSTATVIRLMPSEDRARIMILSALNDASQRAAGPDSLVIPADSIPDNEI